MEKTGRYFEIRFLSTVISIIIGFAFSYPDDVKAAQSPDGVTLISCDRSGVVLEMELPDYSLSERYIDDETYLELTVPGWGRLIEPGKPALPQTGVLIAMPPQAEAVISVESVEFRTISLLNPLPAPALQTDARGENIEERFLPDARVYSSSSYYPDSWATLGQPTWLRSFWVVPVRITPFRSRTGQGDALIAEKLRLRVAFRGGQEGRFISDPHGEVLARSTILNFEQARSWQDKPPTPRTESVQVLGQYKLLVESDGLYCITAADLVAAGVDTTSLDPQTLKIFLQDQQIPIWVEGEWDGSFDADDYILFYGTFPRGTYTYENPYTRTNVYWLDWGEENGLRITERPAAPGSAPQAEAYKARIHVEVDTLYEKFGLVANLNEDIDHWMWYKLDATYEPEFNFLLDLPGLVIKEGSTYDLTISLRGATDILTADPDHHVKVYWSDQGPDPWLALEYLWDGQDALTATSGVPYYKVSSTAPNELLFYAEQIEEIFPNSFYLDYFQVAYWRDYSVLNDTLFFQSPQDMGSGQRRYELTGLQDAQVELWNLTRNERLVDFTYAEGTLAFQDSASDTTYYFVAGKGAWLKPQIVADEPSEWKSPSNGADYLMITHEDFYSDLEPLASHYQELGMRVQRVKVGDIYDEFSFGLKTPQAIFDFIQYAYFNYQPPSPTYILLVGDASWDYKGYDSQPYVDFIPTHSFMTQKWGETASDNWFVSVSGQNPYSLPDCYIGRFPVNTSDEAEVLVQKSLAYAQAPPGYWRSQVIFTNGANSPEIDAPYFDSTAQALIDNYFPEWYDPPRIFSTPSAGYEQYLGDSQDLIQQINLGAAMINYIGHAGNQMWETLDQSQIPLLTNGDKIPFTAAFSCFTGIFSNTTGFGEALILQPGGGAIAYWSNTALGYLYNNGYINDYLFQTLFAEDSLTFGAAATGAKWEYSVLFGSLGDVIETYILLGDPAASFVFEDPDPSDTLDNSPPQISFSVPGTNFRSGDFIQNPVTFSCEVFDSTELELSSLIMELADLNADTVWQWSGIPDSSLLALQGFEINYFGPDSTGHKLEIVFDDSLAVGEWEFTISITDVFFQGPTTLTTSWQISDELELRSALNYPNPFKNETSFTYTLTQDAQVTIKIYTVAGRLIQILQVPSIAGFNIYEWDGRDRQGDPLSNGTYLYKIIARRDDRQVEQVEKMVRLR